MMNISLNPPPGGLECTYNNCEFLSPWRNDEKEWREIKISCLFRFKEFQFLSFLAKVVLEFSHLTWFILRTIQSACNWNLLKQTPHFSCLSTCLIEKVLRFSTPEVLITQKRKITKQSLMCVWESLLVGGFCGHKLLERSHRLSRRLSTDKLYGKFIISRDDAHAWVMLPEEWITFPNKLERFPTSMAKFSRAIRSSTKDLCANISRILSANRH